MYDSFYHTYMNNKKTIEHMYISPTKNKGYTYFIFNVKIHILFYS